MLRQALRWHPPLMIFALAMAALIPVTLVGLVVDDRILVGSPIWLKPFKFAVSLALYSASVAWMLTFLTRGRKVGRWMGTAIAAAATIEMVVIVGQVLRGKRSHFNFETALDGALFSIMGGTIVTLWLLHAVIAGLLVFSKIENPVTALSIRLGLVIAFAGLGVAFLMTGPRPGQSLTGATIGAHSVGAVDGGPTMAVTAWNTTAGDLRVPHFVGMHALQFLPLLVLLFNRWMTTRLVWVAGGFYAGLLGLLTWQALRGQALFSPDATTLTALAVLLAATAVGVLTSLPARKVAVAA